MQHKLDELKTKAHELDKLCLEFTKECKSLAKELTDRLRKRRRKFCISVEVDTSDDLSMYEFDVYIDNVYYVMSYPIDFDEELNEDEILKECDKFYDSLNG